MQQFLTGAERQYRDECNDEARGRAYDMADQLTGLRESRREGELKTLDAMDKFGGEFVKAIAHAARIADLTNYGRLRNAFDDLWKQYADEHKRRVEKKYD